MPLTASATPNVPTLFMLRVLVVVTPGDTLPPPPLQPATAMKKVAEIAKRTHRVVPLENRALVLSKLPRCAGKSSHAKRYFRVVSSPPKLGGCLAFKRFA